MYVCGGDVFKVAFANLAVIHKGESLLLQNMYWETMFQVNRLLDGTVYHLVRSKHELIAWNQM